MTSMSVQPTALGAQIASLRSTAEAIPAPCWLPSAVHALILACLARLFGRLENLIQLWQSGLLLPHPAPASQPNARHDPRPQPDFADFAQHLQHLQYPQHARAPSATQSPGAPGPSATAPATAPATPRPAAPASVPPRRTRIHASKARRPTFPQPSATTRAPRRISISRTRPNQARAPPSNHAPIGRKTTSPEAAPARP